MVDGVDEGIAGRRRESAGRRSILTAACGLALLLAGCAAPPPPPPPPPPTVVQVTAAAAPNANPSATGRPSPVVVRVYYLASPASFQQADYFVLLNQEAQALGADLIGRDEVIVAPGTSQTVRRELRPDARYVAVAAFYQAPERATWRSDVLPVPPNQTTTLRADIQSSAVSLGPGR